MEKTRCYVLTHSFLSPIQRGIQAAHACVELVTNSGSLEDPLLTLVSNWAMHDKTLIVLDGGNSKALEDFEKLLKKQNILPHASFYEDEESLNQCLTAVAFVAPESFYEDPLFMGIKHFGPHQKKLHPIYEKIKSCRLA